jgi:serine/threonine-protein kinase
VAALVLFPAPLLPNERQVGRVLGLEVEAARQELDAAGLAAEIVASEPHPTAPSGTVFWQDPPSGVAVPSGAAVALTVSAGPPRIAVPDVFGLDLQLAGLLVAAAGLRVAAVDSVETKTVAAGIAVGSDPAARDSVPLGRSLVIHLAR